MNGNPLVPALQTAVPLLIAELHALPPTGPRFRRIEEWRQAAIDPIAHQADVLLYGGGRRGDTARVFVHVARGLASLSFSPGGVCVFGLLWCATHHQMGQIVSVPTVCAKCAEAGP